MMRHQALFPFIIVFFFLVIKTGFTQESSDHYRVLIHSEFGSYNKAYKDGRYTTNNEMSFPVFMWNTGAECGYRYDDGYSFGGGFVGTQINGGKKLNGKHYEDQPDTSIMVPYGYIGSLSRLWGYEIGLSYYLTIEHPSTRWYQQSDGTETISKDGGPGLKRQESYVLINFLIRIFPEDSYHLKIKFGRERFNAIDSLFTICTVIPYKNHSGEFYFALPTRYGNFYPESNQRFGFTYSFAWMPIKVGITLSYLSYNDRGGGNGDMGIDSFERFSVGLDVSGRF